MQQPKAQGITQFNLLKNQH